MLRITVKRLTSVVDGVSAGLTAASVGRLSASSCCSPMAAFESFDEPLKLEPIAFGSGQVDGARTCFVVLLWLGVLSASR
jgi:hypothetical protein